MTKEIQELTPSTPLQEDTRVFLQRFRETNSFKYGYNLHNMQFVDPNRFSEKGRRQAIFVQSFIDNLFTVQTVEQSTALFEPWKQWGIAIQQHREKKNFDEIDTTAEIILKKEAYDTTPIPPEIQLYQGDLPDSDLKEIASNLMWLTREVNESIDFFENADKPASLETLFRVQDILEKPVPPLGGIHPEETVKPNVRRIEYHGKKLIVIEFDDKPAEGGFEDPSTDTEWERWDKLQVGIEITYLHKNRRTKIITLESGFVQAFDLLGAGDSMLWGPNVASIGIVALNARTKFYEYALVKDIRLDGEYFTAQELETAEKPEPFELAVIDPQTGDSHTQTYESEDEAIEEITKQIENSIKDEDIPNRE